MSVTIHGTAKSRAVRNIWMAEELGLAYAHDPVDFRDGGSMKPDYLALNDMGQVPAMSDEGVVLTESLAINLYLAKKHGGPLGPRDLIEDALMTKWTLFAATQVEGPGIVCLQHALMLPEDKRDAKLLDETIAKSARAFKHLDRALEKGGGWLVGGRFTAADINVAMCVFYFRGRPDVVASYPHVATWWADVTGRPAYKKAMALRGD
ncbi:glutathione S-transferase family protein [Terrarubrum flagellatum]|uniref:glutathione S-transferase family protein n=1 Tax=Terrirubrum flagellatum TaxID=2895980 RepID=UPI0031454095